MARQVITGHKEIEDAISQLIDKVADKVARAALGGAMSATAAAIRREAPKGPSGNLRRGIKGRFVNGSRKNKPTAKVGVNVGKQSRAEREAGRILRAPHAHLVALGTAKRQRKSIGGRFAYLSTPTAEQLSTGTMPANDFVRRGYQAASGKSAAAMIKRAIKALEREAKKLKR